jgi:predicted phosphodiesterase
MYINENGPIHAQLLHLSDLHFGTKNDAQLWYSQLAEDLTQELNCQKLDAIIMSGDIANTAEVEEYNAAITFLERLCNEFDVDKSNLVIVPGNHDLDWKLSKKSYKLAEKEDTDKTLVEGEYIPVSKDVIRLRDNNLYEKRFASFQSFYREIKGELYPLESSRQGTIHYIKTHDLLVLALNSAWQIDHHYKTRAGISPAAVSNALDKIRQNKDYADCRYKFTVWHHPLNSPFDDRITDHGFLERLAQSGFMVGFHGHLHKTISEPYRYDQIGSGRRIEIVGGGTFGAPSKAWYPGYPLQYHLVKIYPKQIMVQSRCRLEINGAWKPHAIWTQGPGRDPLSCYMIDLDDMFPKGYESRKKKILY